MTAFAQSDAHGGVISGSTGATDNNEIMVRSTNEVFKFQADAPFYFEVCLQYTEANTDDANVAVGLADAAGANLLVDDGGGAGINSSGVLIYKVDGGTVWRCNSENNAVVTDTVSIQTAGGSSYQRLGISGLAVDGTNYEIEFSLDGKPLTDSNNKAIKHTLAYASATEMRLVVAYVKAGSANSETVLVDYVHFNGKRVNF